MADEKKPLSTGTKVALVAAAVSVATPLTMLFEGLVRHPYRDPVSIPTGSL